ncbi:MAG: tRNA 2-thiouridine(34) synthase MnmA [Calditrichaeota bacterium]|nr:tRNA 2-thiouridine(34) synthase MnmA [Calditrichota bacterium]RQW00051.1 MAG: tRNA 2-thiouridine(34) synthase MnmA [Calditrichota bacterium]
MKVAVLLSGGVDSSVGLRLLREQGHDITAFYLKIWLEDELTSLGECPWEEDLQYARGVCQQTGVPLQILPFQREYWDTIVSYSIRELKAGRTPNSDMFCNRLIKFGLFVDKIGSEFDKVASGHYARIEKNNGNFILKRSPDPVKDQTYFLAYMQQHQLTRTIFPLGNYTKKEVRKLAHDFDLPNKNRKDSQGICFLGQIRYTDFVKYHLGEKPGQFIDIETGDIVGYHKGYWFYTIGQRQGLGLSGGPWYVLRKDTDNNLLYLSRNREIRDDLNRTFKVGEFNWISGEKPEKQRLQVKVRHGEQIINCRLHFKNNSIGEVILEHPDQGLAPGQFAVFYDGDICLGGGIIRD